MTSDAGLKRSLPWAGECRGGDDKGGTAVRFSVHKPLLGLAVVAAATAGLTSCKFGVTEPASRVHDTSAVLNGRAYSEEAGTTRWWFEYGQRRRWDRRRPKSRRT